MKDNTYLLQVSVIQSGKDLQQAIAILAMNLGESINPADFQISNVSIKVPENTKLLYIPNENDFVIKEVE